MKHTSITMDVAKQARLENININWELRFPYHSKLAAADDEGAQVGIADGADDEVISYSSYIPRMMEFISSVIFRLIEVLK